jgi:hypothetical protein
MARSHQRVDHGACEDNQVAGLAGQQLVAHVAHSTVRALNVAAGIGLKCGLNRPDHCRGSAPTQ